MLLLTQAINVQNLTARKSGVQLRHVYVTRCDVTSQFPGRGIQQAALAQSEAINSGPAHCTIA